MSSRVRSYASTSSTAARILHERVVAPHPTTGFVIGTGFGQQQRASVLEPKAHQTAFDFGRLLLIDAEAASLHQMDDESDGREVEQEVLSSLPHGIEWATDCR